MANNIQAISSMKRLIFIDNISNEEAKNISNKHKYVICFSNDDGSETIWKGGKPYSYIRGISTQSIKIGSSYIKLNVDSNGILSLVNDRLVQEFNIKYVKSSNNEIISLQNNEYNIYFNDNKFKLGFECIDKNSNVTLDHPEFLFNYRNNLYEIYYNKIAGTDEYICEIINKLENITGNNNKQFIIKLEDLEQIYNFNIKYYPQNVTWYNSNNQQISSITLDNDNDITILFKLDKTLISELNTGYKLNVYVDNILDNNLSKVISDSTTNNIIINKSIFSTNNTNHTLELEYTDPSNHSILTKRYSEYKLNILTPEVQSTDLFYIGNNITSNEINPTEIKDNLIELGWHRFELNYYDYNDNPLTVSNSWCVIIPENANLRVKLYEIANDITTYVIDNDSYNVSNITVNGNTYKKMTPKFTSTSFINTITIN